MLLGAVAKDMQGLDYGERNGDDHLGTDIAVGEIIKNAPKQRASDKALLQMFDMIGVEVTMDILSKRK